MNEPAKEVADSILQVKHHPNVHPLEGQKFGMLTVISRDGTDKHRNALWKCLCDCGETKTLPALRLRQGHVQSCGCATGRLISEARITVDFVGLAFGRLTVLERLPRLSEIHREGRWLCRCACGTELSVGASNLQSGNSNSCGCLQRELLSKRQTIHGLSRPGKRSDAYGIWCGMMTRCYKSSDKRALKYYQRKGISVCRAWHDPSIFVADMGEPGPGLTIERRNNNAGYWCGKCEECNRLNRSPNCSWETRKVQSRNRSSNRFLTFNGETLCLTDMAQKHGMTKELLGHRLKAGWSIEEALMTPVKTPKQTQSETAQCPA